MFAVKNLRMAQKSFTRLFNKKIVWRRVLLKIDLTSDLTSSLCSINTAQKMKFSIKDFFSKCDQIRSFLQMWSHLLKKFLMKNFIFCASLFLSVIAYISGEHLPVASSDDNWFLYESELIILNFYWTGQESSYDNSF